MKSFKKRILAAGLALAVVASIGGATVFASIYSPQATDPSTICGYGVTGKSDVKYNTAYAYTSYGGYADTVSVESTYIYYDNVHRIHKTETKRNGHYRSARVEFTVPAGCTSISISSNHYLSKGGQRWYAETYDNNQA